MLVTETSTYANVTLDPAANVYFDGKCVSHTFHLADGTRKSAGVILPATLNFGTGAPEIMELHSGACRVRLAGSEHWTTYGAGDSFSVPGDSSFDIEVTDAVSYVCHYG
ncbi:pyrimidine/purine nucleoside phosphorylase [Gordonia sp. C13]|uniref:pyrimidine/purine nucleoside phosphorylase n=1 Tax=Gordonia sp. C13 TaxID=2935078 RepID=UPI00200A8EFC|nr:pyrimidine/purine nucleoside phosphorylase [Gordonia sp. C13]MCK8612371.1 pyrimidine/purine nucleoside phosphorylase [Gordonia sp. C13]